MEVSLLGGGAPSRPRITTKIGEREPGESMSARGPSRDMPGAVVERQQWANSCHLPMHAQD
ncbi:hypothetical protein [Phyllobacterium sp. LjRoot231]|uniref:hypothetical protein n=1 Tax=Phyllobacterium sp. LjRoot231 TaxID=3342289 RepID=UPI003F5055C9